MPKRKHVQQGLLDINPSAEGQQKLKKKPQAEAAIQTVDPLVVDDASKKTET